MTDKELRKLTRADLLDLLIDQGKELEAMKMELEDVRKQLKSRQILMEQAGSIAEAALRINGIFEAAQAAADQYLENVVLMAGVRSQERKSETADGDVLDKPSEE